MEKKLDHGGVFGALFIDLSKQRVKVNEAYSSWKNIIFGFPKGSILGPLLFNIYLCNLFYFLKDFAIASYADETTICTNKKNVESVITASEKSSAILFI